MARREKCGPGKRIEEFRLRKGLTQAELAEACECSVALLSAVENGHYAPQQRRIIDAMRKVVGIRPAEWFDNA